MLLALMEREVVRMAMLADIVVAAVSQGEVEDKAAHQRSRNALERHVPRLVLPTAGVGKFKHLGVLP